MCVNTPIRRLDGITYWVIEDPAGIYDFINNEIRKQLEEDARSEGREPEKDQRLKTIAKCKWRLDIIEIEQIKLNPKITNYVDLAREYKFSESLIKRSQELKEAIERYAVVIWPIIVTSDDFMLIDGYCRYTTLKMMNVKRIYGYIGMRQY
jgi:hypothetical protein